MIDFSQNKPKQRWFKKEIQNEFGSSIYVNGYVYVPHGDTRHRTAYLKCIEFDTGKEMWTRDTGHCSLIYVNRKFVVLNQWGTLTVMEADEKGYKDLSSARVVDTSSRVRCWTAPVLANGSIYVRTNVGDLISVDVSN
jgi:outer membrane protein assembly factor BamB